MSRLLLLSLIASALVGCASSSSDEGTVAPGSGVATNPGGKPRTEEETARANGMQQQGNAMNDARSRDAAAMAAAKAASGGK